MPVSKRLIALGVGVYAFGSATAYTLFKPPGKNCKKDNASFDSLADNYDAKVDFEETFMGLKLLRRWLISYCQGNVLEISAGTGRNLPYYNMRSLKSLTLTDASENMLFHARQKHDASSSDIPVRFHVADAAQLCNSSPHDACATVSSPDDCGTEDNRAGDVKTPRQTYGSGPRPLPVDGFDCIVDTFGLCSHVAPVEVLKAASRLCRPGGRILLLEHGRSSYGWLNSILDRDADKHKAEWACQWNLPIDEIVKEAGLKVVHEHRWHFGTTYFIVAEPAKSPV